MWNCKEPHCSCWCHHCFGESMWDKADKLVSTDIARGWGTVLSVAFSSNPSLPWYDSFLVFLVLSQFCSSFHTLTCWPEACQSFGTGSRSLVLLCAVEVGCKSRAGNWGGMGRILTQK